jgi:hypothetical protein
VCTIGTALARERPHMVRAGCYALHDTVELQRVPAMLARDGRLAALSQLFDGRLRTARVCHCAQRPPPQSCSLPRIDRSICRSCGAELSFQRHGLHPSFPIPKAAPSRIPPGASAGGAVACVSKVTRESSSCQPSQRVAGHASSCKADDTGHKALMPGVTLY